VNGTLVLTPAQAEDVPGATTLLGLPILCRNLLAARRAGFGRLVVVGERFPALPDGVEKVAPGETLTVEPGRLLLLSPRALATVKGMVALRNGAVTESVRLADGLAALADLTAPLRLAGGSFESAAAGLAARLPVTPLAETPSGVLALTSARDLPRAERWLLDGLLKDNEGFMSRHFERKVSLAISRRLAFTSVTPNAMTVVMVLVGLAAAPFFLNASPAAQTIGSLLFLLHSILDGCDGELARLKFQESRWGGILDFWGDNVVHVAVFTCMGIGWSRAIGQGWPVLLGLSASLGTLLSTGWVYLHTMRGPKEGALFTGVTQGSHLVDKLANRDFIYLVLLLSLFGKADWFLVAAAIGAPTFFLALVWITIRERGRNS